MTVCRAVCHVWTSLVYARQTAGCERHQCLSAACMAASRRYNLWPCTTKRGSKDEKANNGDNNSGFKHFPNVSFLNYGIHWKNLLRSLCSFTMWAPQGGCKTSSCIVRVTHTSASFRMWEKKGGSLYLNIKCTCERITSSLNGTSDALCVFVQVRVGV